MTITPRSVQKWVQERVQNDPYNLHAKNPCGFHATLFVQRLIAAAFSACCNGPRLARAFSWAQLSCGRL